MRGIASIDVAVVDEDLMWRVDHMNAVHGKYVKDFTDFGDAVEALTEGYPAVIVVGPQNAPASIEHLDLVRGPRPEVKVVFVVDAEALPDVLERARQAGAAAVREAFLGDEVEVAEVVLGLLPAEQPTMDIVELRAEADTPPMAAPSTVRLPEQLIVVTSAKGGEGVTTVAANLASSLSAGGARRVALVEGDPNFGDLSLLLDLPAPARQNLERMVIDADTLALFSTYHEEAGIRVVRPPRYEGVYTDVAAGTVLDLLGALTDEVDIVVVDAPLPLVVSADLTSLASSLLLVSTLRTTSLKNAMLSAAALGKPKTMNLVVNEFGRHPHEPDQREVEHATGLNVLAQLPYDGRLDRAESERAPRVLAERRSGFRRAIDDLASQVLGLMTVAAR